MKALTAPLTELGSFQQILEGIAKGNTPVFATGVIDAAKPIWRTACRRK